MARHAYHKPPHNLPASAWGFIAYRPDRPDHVALYRRDGTVAMTAGIDATLQDMASDINGAGFGLCADLAGFVFCIGC